MHPVLFSLHSHGARTIRSTWEPEIVPLNKQQSNNCWKPRWPQVFVLPDDAALVAVVPLHVEVTVVSNGKNVWRQFTNLLVGVLSNLVRRVDRQQLIRVHSHQDGTGVSLPGGRRGWSCFKQGTWLGWPGLTS